MSPVNRATHVRLGANTVRVLDDAGHAVCVRTGVRPKNPIHAPDGFLYDRAALENDRTSIKRGIVMEKAELRPARGIDDRAPICMVDHGPPDRPLVLSDGCLVDHDNYGDWVAHRTGTPKSWLTNEALDSVAYRSYAVEVRLAASAAEGPLVDASGDARVVLFGPGFEPSRLVEGRYGGTLELARIDPKPENLAALRTVHEVTGDVVIRRRAEAGVIDALVGIQRIGGSLAMTHVTNTSTKLRLPALVDVGGSVQLKNDEHLADLEGLSALQRVAGDVTIEACGVTSMSGLDALTEVGGTLKIIDNGALFDLGGLGALANIGGRLVVRDNPGLIEARSHLTALASPAGGALFAHNPVLPPSEELGHPSSWFGWLVGR